VHQNCKFSEILPSEIFVTLEYFGQMPFPALTVADVGLSGRSQVRDYLLIYWGTAAWFVWYIRNVTQCYMDVSLFSTVMSNNPLSGSGVNWNILVDHFG